MNNKKLSYLYITGVSYSGSTLLSFLLNAHQKMMSISEVSGLIKTTSIENYLCSCGQLYLQCPFYLELERKISELGSSFSLRNWQTIFQISHHKWLNIPLMRPLSNVFLEKVRDKLVPLWPDYTKTISEICKRNNHFAQAALAISGKQVFVDATKDSIRIKFLQETQKFDLYVIHLVRDVRGAVSSIMKNKKIKDVRWATRYWYRTNMNSERARRYVPHTRWLRLTYDELCDDIQGTIDRISDFVGIKRSIIPLDFLKTEHHIIGNRMRLRQSNEIKKDDSWKKRLTHDDLKIIIQIAGQANRYFGHSWP